MAKKKAVRLPFVVAPRLEPVKEVIGTVESGQIEIMRRGYLTVAEKAFMSAALVDDDAIKNIRATAIDIARKTGKTQAQVLEDMSKTSSMPSYLEDYQDKILMAIGGLMEYQQRRAIIAATCLLIYRVDRNWGISETLELHPDLRDALAQLYEDEEKKNLEALEQHYEQAAGEEGAEEEGKS